MCAPRWLTWCWLLLGVTNYATERQQLLERRAGAIAYRLPSERVLTVARELLQEQAYLILESRDALYVRTSWRTRFDETLDVSAARERHFVVGQRLDDGLFMLNAYRLSYATIGRTEPHPDAFQSPDKTGVPRMIKGDPLSYARPVLVRDLELEWRILSRVAPAVAHQMEVEVDQSLAPTGRSASSGR